MSLTTRCGSTIDLVSSTRSGSNHRGLLVAAMASRQRSECSSISDEIGIGRPDREVIGIATAALPPSAAA